MQISVKKLNGQEIRLEVSENDPIVLIKNLVSEKLGIPAVQQRLVFKGKTLAACVKTRAEKRGGGRKPWRQKGTGRARQGSIRAPHFIGGGHAHGPKPKSYYYSLPKKVRRMGLRTALSVRYAQGDLHIVDSFKDIESEWDLIPLLEKRGWMNAVLVDSQSNSKLHHAAAEMNKVDVLYSIVLNVYSILLRKKVILTLDAVRTLEERLCEDDRILINKFD